MNCRIQGEINLHVPFKALYGRPGSTDSFHKVGVVCDDVGQDVPVTWRRFRTGAISPEFGEYPSEVTAFDDVGDIGQASCGVVGVARATIHSEGVIAEGAGGDIDGGVVIGSELAASANDVDDLRP